MTDAELQAIVERCERRWAEIDHDGIQWWNSTQCRIDAVAVIEELQEARRLLVRVRDYLDCGDDVESSMAVFVDTRAFLGDPDAE